MRVCECMCVCENYTYIEPVCVYVFCVLCFSDLQNKNEKTCKQKKRKSMQKKRIAKIPKQNNILI